MSARWKPALPEVGQARRETWGDAPIHPPGNLHTQRDVTRHPNIEVKRIAEPGAPIDYEFAAVRTTDHLSALSLVRQGLKNARKPTLIDEARLALAEMLFSLQLLLAPKRTNEGLALVLAIREYALNATKKP